MMEVSTHTVEQWPVHFEVDQKDRKWKKNGNNMPTGIFWIVRRLGTKRKPVLVKLHDLRLRIEVL